MQKHLDDLNRITSSVGIFVTETGRLDCATSKKTDAVRLEEGFQSDLYDADESDTDERATGQITYTWQMLAPWVERRMYKSGMYTPFSDSAEEWLVELHISDKKRFSVFIEYDGDKTEGIASENLARQIEDEIEQLQGLIEMLEGNEDEISVEESTASGKNLLDTLVSIISKEDIDGIIDTLDEPDKSIMKRHAYTLNESTYGNSEYNKALEDLRSLIT